MTHLLSKLLNIKLYAYDSSMHISVQNEQVTEYKVVPYKKKFQHTIQYDSSTGAVKCSCKRFEFSGILCSHALKVLSSRNIMKIPAMYILKRWTKHAKTGNDIASSCSIIHEDPKVRMGNRYKDLCRLQAQLATKGAITEEAYKIAVDGLTKTMNDIDACLGGKDRETSTHDVSLNNIGKVLCNGNNNNVKGIKTKERFRGTSTRPKGVLERRRKKKKTTQEDELPLQNIDCELPSFQSIQLPTYVAYNTSKESSNNMSMMELLQAQLPDTEQVAIDVISLQSQDQEGHP